MGSDKYEKESGSKVEPDYMRIEQKKQPREGRTGNSKTPAPLAKNKRKANTYQWLSQGSDKKASNSHLCLAYSMISLDAYVHIYITISSNMSDHFVHVWVHFKDLD